MVRPGAQPHEVAVLAMPGVIAFELGLPHKILGSARDGSGRPLYRVRVTSVDGGPVETSAGYAVVPAHGPEIVAGASTVIVPGHYGGPQMDDGTLAPGVRELLRAERVVSICTGAFALAAAGLLDGRRATTHWMHAERFTALYPRVDLDPDVLFVDEGDVLTSAGNAAGIDLMLHLVRRDHGSEIAAGVARRNVVAPWREGGQAQFIEHPVPTASGGPGLAAAREWALDHLHSPISLEEMAVRSAMSVRTFTRRFRAETGTSPGRWLTAQRVELARRLLESAVRGLGRLG